MSPLIWIVPAIMSGLFFVYGWQAPARAMVQFGYAVH